MAKVLILDQSKSVRNILRERLEYEGFSTEATENEKEASDMCAKIPLRRDPLRHGMQSSGCRHTLHRPFDRDVDRLGRAGRPQRSAGFPHQAHRHEPPAAIHSADDREPARCRGARRPTAAPGVRRSRRARPAQAEPIIGDSPEIDRVRRLIDRVAPSEARVLITGENGTGRSWWRAASTPEAPAPRDRSSR